MMDRLEEFNVTNKNKARFPARRSVSFGHVSIREFEHVDLNDADSVWGALIGRTSDACLTGCKYKPNKTVTLEEWEQKKEERRKQLAALRVSSKSKKQSKYEKNPLRRTSSDIIVPHRSMFAQKSVRQNPPRRANSDIVVAEKSTRKSAKQMPSTDDSRKMQSKAQILEEWEQMKEKRRNQSLAMRAGSKLTKEGNRKKTPPKRSSSDIVFGTLRTAKQAQSTTDDSTMKRRIKIALQAQTQRETAGLVEMQIAVQRHINKKRVAAANAASNAAS